MGVGVYVYVTWRHLVEGVVAAVDEAAVAGKAAHYGEAMRWEALFADLESQFLDAARTEWEDEIVDLTEAEMATSSLVDRLRARVGRTVSLRLCDGSLVHGELVDAAPQWLLVAESGHRILVPDYAVVVAWPLGEVAPRAGAAERRLRLTHVLRAIAREGTAVRLRTAGGDQRGWIVRVAADHVDLRVDDAGGALPVRGDALRSPGRDAVVVSVALAHLVTVQTG